MQLSYPEVWGVQRGAEGGEEVVEVGVEVFRHHLPPACVQVLVCSVSLRGRYVNHVFD